MQKAAVARLELPDTYCEWLARDIGVAAVPGSSFFHEEKHRYIRFHFAKKRETLGAALERLEALYVS